MIEIKGTNVEGICGLDLFVYAIPSEVKDRYLMFLHQSVRYGKSEVVHARNDGALQEVWQGAEVTREIPSERGRATVVAGLLTSSERIFLLMLVHLGAPSATNTVI